jgi:integrase
LWSYVTKYVSLVTGDVGPELTSLRREAYAFRNAAYAATTKKTYKSQSSCYVKFCLSYGLIPVPASQETLISYCAFLARTLSANSVPGYLNVIRLMHLEAGFKNPLLDNWELSSIQKGISRLLGKPPVQKSPITVKILLDIFQTVSNHPSDVAFWAACLIAFYGFLRKSTLLPSSELMSAGKFIARGDVVDLTLSSFSLLIKKIKTIQFGQRLLTLHYVSSSDIRQCPVRAVMKHLAVSKLSSTAPLFDFLQDGSQVSFSHALFIKRLKSGLLRSGNKASNISCHSFRRGGATLAFSVGMSAIDIKLRGDWKSNAFERYVTVAPESSLASVRTLTSGASVIAGGYV